MIFAYGVASPVRIIALQVVKRVLKVSCGIYSIGTARCKFKMSLCTETFFEDISSARIHFSIFISESTILSTSIKRGKFLSNARSISSVPFGHGNPQSPIHNVSVWRIYDKIRDMSLFNIP